MSVVHSTFSLERQYKAAPARVFAAFANPETKRRWFVEGEGWRVNEYAGDFRVGGVETSRFTFAGSKEKGAPPAGTPIANDTVYQDIVPNERIVFAYTMTVGDKRISASLATVEIVPSGTGTKLTYTEQGAYFDGSDDPRMRQEGWTQLFASLERELDRA
ncbi:SRPBCC family protein [Pendulispora brunnea]|uniref:SRPBCC family protein n=1 Tax=Pendulispora brunnea TaxID=2905690 RepID=A0ABZ2KAH4_9BACT